MSKIRVPLHVLTACDVTSSSFSVGKKAVRKQIQKNTEAQMLLTNLSREYLNKYVMKYIYNDNVSTTLTEMRALKWKHKKKQEKKSLCQNRT